ncbi:MAG: hypothetical protein ACI8UP_003389, partial [Porticoccaceae bacterium]
MLINVDFHTFSQKLCLAEPFRYVVYHTPNIARVN